MCIYYFIPLKVLNTVICTVKAVNSSFCCCCCNMKAFCPDLIISKCAAEKDEDIDVEYEVCSCVFIILIGGRFLVR